MASDFWNSNGEEAYPISQSVSYLETEVKHGLESLEGTQTEKLDQILSLLVPHTRS